ncbi:hypothetical protein [Kerstersia gyiorum]|uniref:hypothetical protein n=1 Tax=Kerstersia gyiorum TaxID=206506 RepID=UPI00209FA03F|nr:hypothetical protein [Kerstersia gyiorum]MCP1632895.1 hypothetical protein [Kerstersia gyiorum]MCP1635573.1 hypothetical protein [Kerstersia gyiorum]MCP1671021.1 hypothetical protein [Kerstersia gyiorum]MCP1678325.1 hypothetical protein [Kerstersia gyiorum]MCP1682124.1 hypothetical protein [Kerstersia gyiorum]
MLERQARSAGTRKAEVACARAVLGAAIPGKQRLLPLRERPGMGDVPVGAALTSADRPADGG